MSLARSSIPGGTADPSHPFSKLVSARTATVGAAAEGHPASAFSAM